MQHKLQPDELFALCKTLRGSSCAAQFIMQCTLDGFRDRALLESFAARALGNVALLKVEAADASKDREYPAARCIAEETDLSNVWFTSSTVLKLLKYAHEDEVLMQALASRSILQSIMLGVYYANYVHPLVPCSDGAICNSASIFRTFCMNDRAYAERDKVLAAAFSTAAEADKQALAEYKSSHGNLLCTLARMASIDTQYLLLKQFTCPAEKDEDAYCMLKNAFGRTFKTLLSIGISPFEAPDDGKPFASMVGMQTLKALAAEKYEQEEKQEAAEQAAS